MDSHSGSPFSVQYSPADYYRQNERSPYRVSNERSEPVDYRPQHNVQDDETNPLFISAVRIFLEYIREKHGVACPEKECSLEQLIHYLEEFQGEARTKKGETYSPSTIRVIRYSLNRVIALGKNQQEMRPYPTQTTGIRKRRRNEGEAGWGRSQSRATKRMPAVPLTMSKPNPFEPISTPYGRPNPGLVASGKLETRLLPSKQPFKPTADGVNTFRWWLSEQRQEPAFETYSRHELNHHLTQFYRSGQNGFGKDWSRTSVLALRQSLLQHLRKTGLLVDRDPFFELSTSAYRAWLDSFGSLNEEVQCVTPKPSRNDRIERPSDQDNGIEWLGIPVEYIKNFYRSGALSNADCRSLQRKVWFELTIFFRSVPCCPDQMYWTKNTFKVAFGEQGVKYVELNPEMYSRYGNIIGRRGEEGRIMVQRPGSPFCPVSSLELYLSCLDPDGEALFPAPLDNCYSVLAKNKIFYSREPSSTASLSCMMNTIAQLSRSPFQFSNLSARETDHMCWMRAVTALELEAEMPDDNDLDESQFRRSTPNSRGSVIQTAPVRSQASFGSSPSRRCESPSSFLSRNFSSNSESSGDVTIIKKENPGSPGEQMWNKKTKLLNYAAAERSSSSSSSLQIDSSPRSAYTDESPARPHQPFNIALRTLQAWSAANGRSYELSRLIEKDLDDLFRDFLHFSFSQRADRSMINDIEAGINRAMAELGRSNVTMDSLAKTRRILKEYKGLKDEEEPLTVEDMEAMYLSGVFDPTQQKTLQYKIIFELYIHFYRLAVRSSTNDFWKRSNFQLINGPGGRLRVVFLGAAMAENDVYIDSRPGDRNCPVAAFRKYREMILGSDKIMIPAFSESSSGKPTTLTRNSFAAFLSWIGRGAKLPRVLTEEDLLCTPVSTWTTALNLLQEVRSATASAAQPSVKYSRPGAKRVLEHYRQATSISNEIILDQSPGRLAEEKVDESIRDKFDVASVISSPGTGGSGRPQEDPLIIVRPQILVINTGGGVLERNTLKHLISEALLNATDMPEWDRAISRALDGQNEKADSGYCVSRRESFSGVLSQNSPSPRTPPQSPPSKNENPADFAEDAEDSRQGACCSLDVYRGELSRSLPRITETQDTYAQPPDLS